MSNKKHRTLKQDLEDLEKAWRELKEAIKAQIVKALPKN